MSFEIKNLEVKSSNKTHTLIGKLYIPQGEIKGIVHIVHGMTEHIKRYDRLMSALAESGYIACGYDNLGHGNTARNDSELGFFAHKNGWKYLVEDVKVFAEFVKKTYPLKPYILMGHSMGSFITRLAAAEDNSYIDKLIICGTSGKNPLSGIGIALTGLIKTVKGEKHISKLIINMAFGSYNKRFDGKIKYEWLTKDKTEIEKYTNDKFCTFDFTVSAMQDLIILIDRSNRKIWFESIPENLPILIISGTDDPVGNYGKGVRQVYKKLLERNLKPDMILYENCRHEILNDTCREEVICDILKFINKA